MSITSDGPHAYFITFSCYGSWLHGAQRGSVDRQHRIHGARFLPPDPVRCDAEVRRMKAPPLVLGARQRGTVLNAIRGVCGRRCWELLAAHVRTRHVHAVVRGPVAPEKVMTDLKSYATRALKALDGARKRERHWARHGSTVYLWDTGEVDAAVHYVVHEQGRPMAVYEAFPDEHDGPRQAHGRW